MAGLLEEFRSGTTVYIPGATGEIAALRQVLIQEPQYLAGVTLVSCLLPGINNFDYAGLHADCEIRTFLLSAHLRSSFALRRVKVLPLSYSSIASYLSSLAPDVAILHLTLPENGSCSFGVVADFGPIVAPKAKRRIGILNHSMPRPVYGRSIELGELDVIVEIDEPCRPVGQPEPSAELETIGRNIAALIPDGATVQAGIGQAPGAMWRSLRGHRGIRLWSGMITDGFFDAYDAGAMASAGHVAGIAAGTETLYARLDKTEVIRFADVQETHGYALFDQQRLIAVNSALEIDLFGQANLEWQEGRLISGAGGAPDFAAAAKRSRDGQAMTALPATARKGMISRIVPRLSSPAASLTRTEIDTVVTEFGSASLRNLDMDDRAAAIIELAHPAHRAALATGWESIRKNI